MSLDDFTVNEGSYVHINEGKLRDHSKELNYDAFPSILQIESTNKCNFSCVICDSRWQQRPKGEMRFEVFKAIIDQFRPSTLWGAILQGWGEPLLCEDLFQMVKYLSDRRVFGHFNTNGSLVAGENIEKIFESGLQSIAFSIDALDEKTAEKIRANSKKYPVYQNLIDFIKEKKRRGCGPRVMVDFTISNLNLDQVGPTLKFCEMIGVDVFNVHDFFPYPNVVKRFPEIRQLTDEELLELKGILNNARIQTVYDSWKESTCRLLRNWMYIDWDGRVFPCCHFHSTDFLLAENPFDLLSVWHGAKLNAWRQAHIKYPLCKKCLVL